MIMKFNLFEKMGVSSEVMTLSDFFYNKIIKTLPKFKGDNADRNWRESSEMEPIDFMPVKNPELTYMINNVPKNKYNINKIKIDLSNINGFNNSDSTKTEDGVMLCFLFDLRTLVNYNINNPKRLKELITHEMNHGCDWVIKNRMIREPSINYKDYFGVKVFGPNLYKYLYLADEREIKSRVHEYYSFLKQRFKNKKNVKIQDIKNLMDEWTHAPGKSNSTYGEYWGMCRELIDYDIRKDVSEEKFLDFKSKSKYKISSLEKLQNHIRKRGEYFKRRLNRIDSMIISESND